MKKLMILGAGIYQLPAIKCAKQLGHKVITVDYYPFNIGHRFSDHYENISTVDCERVFFAAQKHKIDGIMTIASDVAVPTVAYVASKLDLSSITPEQATIMSSKIKSREFLHSKRLPAPLFKEVTNLDEATKFFNEIGPPLFIKPSDRSGSKGVGIINSLVDLYQKFPKAQSASLEGLVCLETFLEGTEVGCEAFCFNGVPKLIVITNKKLTKDFVVCGHSLPCNLSPEVVEQIKTAVRNVSMALDVQLGPVNLDIIVTENGPYIIDIGARLGGNGLPIIVGYSTGIDTIKLAVKIALGEKPNFHKKLTHFPVGVRIFGAPYKSILKSYEDVEDICNRFKDIIDLVILYKPGEKVYAFTEGGNTIGYVIARGKDLENVISTMDAVERCLNFQYIHYR